MEALVENAAAPPSRFYCHSCAVEIDRVSSEFTCPHCLEGFIEELPAAERSNSSGPASGQSFEQPSNDYNHASISPEAIRLAGEIFTNSLLFLRNDGPNGEAGGEHALFNMDDIPMDGSSQAPSGASATAGGGSSADGSEGATSSGSGGGAAGGGGASGDSRPSMRYPGRRGSRRRGVQNINHVDHILREILISVSGGANGGGGGGGGSMLFMGNPGDYAWGREGIDTIVTQLLNQMDNTGPPPLEKERIAEIPTVRIDEEQVDRKLQCSVCFEDFVVDETVRKLPCSHVYHEPCIIPWLELHGTCPICRKSLSTEDGGMHGGSHSQTHESNPQSQPGAGSQQNAQQQTSSSQSDGVRQSAPNFLTFSIRPAMTNLLFPIPAAAVSSSLPQQQQPLPSASGGSASDGPHGLTDGSTTNRPGAPSSGGGGSSSTQTGNSQRDDDGTVDYHLDLD